MIRQLFMRAFAFRPHHSAVGLVLLAGCAIELDDIAGRACDEARPCRAPRACVAARCVDPIVPDSGNSFDGSFPISDAGVDAGPARWQQRLHGFTRTTVEPGCEVNIDLANGNRVRATIVSPLDSQDTATAVLVDAARLPRTLDARIKGRITLPSSFSVRGYVPLVFLGTQAGQAFIRVGFDAAGQLVVESDPQTVGDFALVERFSVDGGFTAGDWLFEVAYRVGTAREVRINDVVRSYAAVGGGASLPPDELSLGIARYDGDAGGALSVSFSSWQLADDLLVTLP